MTTILLRLESLAFLYGIRRTKDSLENLCPFLLIFRKVFTIYEESFGRSAANEGRGYGIRGLDAVE